MQLRQTLDDSEISRKPPAQAATEQARPQRAGIELTPPQEQASLGNSICAPGPTGTWPGSPEMEHSRNPQLTAPGMCVSCSLPQALPHVLISQPWRRTCRAWGWEWEGWVGLGLTFIEASRSNILYHLQMRLCSAPGRGDTSV